MVLGSYEKLQKFYDSTHPERIFNEIRPKYSIKKYVNILEYNFDMRKVFSEKVITKTEKDAIVNWTIDSTEIKKVMWGISEDKKAKNYANILFSLFDKYESNLKKGTKLYRGMSFTEEMFEKFGFDKTNKGKIEYPDNKAIVSFSTDKKKAFEYATMTNRKYKVVYILENETEALDISKISAKPEEKESIITKGKEYLVTYTRIFNRGDEIWKVIKLKKM